MKRYVIRYPLAFLLPLGLLLLPTLAISEQAPSAAYKCWTDEEGVTTCGNVVPADVSQKGFDEVNEQGIRVKKVGPAPSAAEIAEEERQKAAEEKRKQPEIFSYVLSPLALWKRGRG